MRQQQRTAVTLAHKYRLRREAHVAQTLLVQIRRSIRQRRQHVVHESLLGHHCRIVLQQLVESLVVSEFQFQARHVALVVRHRRKVQLMFVHQRLVPLTLRLQGLRKGDILVQFRTNVHHTTPFAVHLLTIETAYRQHHRMLLAIIPGCQ